MNSSSLSRSALLALLVSLSSCASTRVGRDAEDLNGTGVITMKEWQEFATEFYAEMQANGAWQAQVFKATPDKPLVLGIDNIHIEGNSGRSQYGQLSQTKFQMMNALRTKIVSANAGSVVVNMDISGSATAASDQSSLINRVRDGARGSVEYNQENVAGYGEKLAPTIGLQGTVVVNRFKEEGGRARKSDYQVAFRLVDLRRAVTIGEMMVSLPKSFRPGLFGG